MNFKINLVWFGEKYPTDEAYKTTFQEVKDTISK